MAATAAAEARRRALLFVVLAAASWGTGTVLSKAAVAEMPPITLLGVQLVVSVIVLRVLMRRGPRPSSAVDARMALLGALNPGLAYGLSLMGLTMISASASVLIWAMEPILILLVAGIFLGERPGAAIVALSAAAIGGLAVAVGLAGDRLAVTGVVLSVAGVLCCVAYSVATRRWIAGSPSTLRVVAAQDVVALVVVGLATVAAAAAGWSPIPATVSVGGVVSAVASGLLYYGAAYLLYIDALRVLPVSIAAVSFYLVPVFGIVAATLAGERLTAIAWLGAITTIAAVLAVGAIDVRRSTTEEALLASR